MEVLDRPISLILCGKYAVIVPISLSVVVYGQGDKRQQIRQINAKAEIVVATPGRLNEFSEKGESKGCLKRPFFLQLQYDINNNLTIILISHS